MRLFRSLLV